MPSVRKDIFTGAHVIISELRGSRPLNIVNAEYYESGEESCPFCPGNEFMTPGFSSETDLNWQMRFFPNKYPALAGVGGAVPENPLYSVFSGKGAHEIFVDARRHDVDLKDFSPLQVEKMIHALKGRYDFYRADKSVRYIQIFKNKGLKAGATQVHSHWQIIAGGFVPFTQEIIAKNLALYKTETRRCLYCAVLESELADGCRVVFENRRFAVIAPFASRFTYETWIMPKKHVSSFAKINKSDVFYLAEALLYIVTAIERIKNNVDYNIILMDAPRTSDESLFHWHIQVLPRMGGSAGYELSTGGYINHITPEKAAETLRAERRGGKK